MLSGVRKSIRRDQYRICQLRSHDQNEHPAPQDGATVFNNKLKREDIKRIIIDLAFNS